MFYYALEFLQLFLVSWQTALLRITLQDVIFFQRDSMLIGENGLGPTRICTGPGPTGIYTGMGPTISYTGPGPTTF